MKQIKITCQANALIPLADLTELQGNLKSLSRDNFMKLSNEIIKDGFSFAVHVWKNEGKTYILDGHQRIKTIREMVKSKEYYCHEIPVVLVEAENYKAAKRKVLAAASQYGKTEETGLLEFMQDMDLTPEELSSRFDFADLDILNFIESNFEEFKEVKDDSQGTTIGEENSQNMNVSGVRMVQLFLNEDNFAEFTSIVNKLALKFQTANLTETILRTIREVHKS